MEESEGGKEKESDDGSEQGCATTCPTRERHVKAMDPSGVSGPTSVRIRYVSCVRCVHLPIRMREV
jgi:hypothetical protein